MAFDLTGVLYEKFDTVQRTATFKVREFVVETSKEINGREMINYIKFQLVQDKTELIDTFNNGDPIKVHFNIRGSKWQKNNQVSYFNNLDAWKIEKTEGNSAELKNELPDDLPGNEEFPDENDILPF